MFYQVLGEYRTVMAKVAMALDTLQKSDTIFYGTLLPTLFVLRQELEELQRDEELQYARPLVNALLDQDGERRGFRNRHVTRAGHLRVF